MRYLNKIVFINSAHIRYAEVAMAGNIHFTGTQGVGKTTLLRALLFFYNCRKDRLGIRTQGQQSFDNFYIPTSSSYIVYEVSRSDDEHPFSIILFRHKNRAVFRFVDAPYSKDWFVDEYGMVASDYLTVRQRIQNLGIDASGIVERYTQYLDIIYGNRNAQLSKDLTKYYLLKSRQYHNIPRIIQNVFLNERVDAAFIKNTIINSISGEEEEIAVDLNFFRSKLVHFSDELKDISLWTEVNRQGIVETRVSADNIIKISHGVKASRRALREQCGMLRYAMDKVERDIPTLKNRIEKKEESIRQIDRRLNELTSRFEQEKKKLSDRIAVLTHDLKRASELRKEYQRIGIEEMIERAGKLESLKLELQQKERILDRLRSDYKSIADKYETIRNRMELDKELYIQSCKGKKNNILEEFNTRECDRLQRRSKLEFDIRNKSKDEIAEIRERQKSYSELLQEQKLQRVRISASSPMKEELTECENCIKEEERKIHQLSENKLTEEKRHDSIMSALELEIRQIESDTALQIKDIDGKINRVESLKKEELQLLSHVQGSLSEWLDDNVDGWERNIGKIADEKVLYSLNLNPCKSVDGSDSIFGISLDLDSIEKVVRTPAMIRESVEKLDKELASLANEIIALHDLKDRRIAAKEKEVRSEINSIKVGIDTISQNILLCQKTLNEQILRLDDIKEQEKRYIDEVISVLDEKIQNTQLQIDDFEKEGQTIAARWDGELRKVSRKINEEIKSDKAQRDEQLKAIGEEIAAYTKSYEAKLFQLENEEAAELSKSGADNLLMESTKKEIAGIRDSLDRIDREREKITEYRKDCRDLLDNVVEMQMDKKSLENEAASLQQKYDERRKRHELKKDEELQAISSLCRSYSKALESKRHADEFVASKNYQSELKEEGAIQTTQDCLTIISAIKDLIGEIYRGSDSLKETTNEFRRRFSQNNTFKFPTSFDTLDDYHRYADSLEDFVTNDKIKEFQHVTSNLYRDILSRAASDFNILLSRESEILKIIRDINYDFEKKTFAGVIRRIELRLDRSTMPIITQLQNITDFWQSHQYELGEINLFSTDEHYDTNREAIKYLKSLSAALTNTRDMQKLPLEQTFALKFQIQENDNTTEWVENLRAVGSEGTDILVKAIVNILLISVFKKRAGQSVDFRLHCMMDEIGRLADENIQGILNFANERGIFIVNSSPKAHRPLSYRHLYVLSKDEEANTVVQPILSTREAKLK